MQGRVQAGREHVVDHLGPGSWRWWAWLRDRKRAGRRIKEDESAAQSGSNADCLLLDNDNAPVVAPHLRRFAPGFR